MLKTSLEYLLQYVLHQVSMGSHSCDPRALEIYNILKAILIPTTAKMIIMINIEICNKYQALC